MGRYKRADAVTVATNLDLPKIATVCSHFHFINQWGKFYTTGQYIFYAAKLTVGSNNVVGVVARDNAITSNTALINLCDKIVTGLWQEYQHGVIQCDKVVTSLWQSLWQEYHNGDIQCDKTVTSMWQEYCNGDIQCDKIVTDVA